MKVKNTPCSIYCLTDLGSVVASVMRYATKRYPRNAFKLHQFKIFCKWKTSIEVEWYTSTEYDDPTFWREALNYITRAHKWDNLIKLHLETMYNGILENSMASGLVKSVTDCGNPSSTVGTI